MNPLRDQFNPNVKPMFDEFINTAKKELSMDQYTQFLRHLSLLLTGQIAPELFIRLFLQILGPKKNRDNHLVQMLPLFLASVKLGIFYDASAEFYEALDNIAAEIVIYSKTKYTNGDAEKSLNKCFELLSNGTISPNVAKKWLANYCPPEMIKKLDLLDNFTLFHPSNFPASLISKSDSDVETEALNVFQEFQQTQIQTFSARTVNPVTVDVLESKMKSSRKVIGKLVQGVRVKAHEINYMYGEKSHDVSLALPENYPKILLRASKIFEQDRNMLISLLVAKMNRYSINDLERRVLFKRLLNQNTLGYLYTIPGMRSIEFQNQIIINIGLSALEFFIKVIFKDDGNEILEKIPIFASLFESKNVNMTKTCDSNLIYALTFFKVFYDQLTASGDDDEVVLPIEGEQNPNSFGSQIHEMILSIRTDTSHEKEWPLANSDLTLLRIARFVARLSSESLMLFPTGIDRSAIYTTVTPRGLESGISIECVSVVSPCAIVFNNEQDDGTDSLEEPAQEK